MQNFNKILQTFIQTLSNFISKANSRKFIVWIIATHMAYIGLLESNSWLTISTLYVSAETALDWKFTSKPKNEEILELPNRPIQ